MGEDIIEEGKELSQEEIEQVKNKPPTREDTTSKVEEPVVEDTKVKEKKEETPVEKKPTDNNSDALLNEISNLKKSKSKDEKDIIDKLYTELKRSHEEMENMNNDFEKRFSTIKMEMNDKDKQLKDTEEEAKKASDEAKVKDEIVKIKDAELKDVNERLGIIEEERKVKIEAQRFDKISHMIVKYQTLGLINDTDKDSKIDELRQMSDIALDELGNVLSKKLEEEPEISIPTSEEIKNIPSQPSEVDVKEKDAIDSLFDKLR